jgi:hypothetical protein
MLKQRLHQTQKAFFTKFNFVIKSQPLKPQITKQEGAIKSKNKIFSKFSYDITKTERSLVRNIVENPDTQISLTEQDIHTAIKNSGTLPEDELRSLIGNYKQEKDLNSFLEQLDNKILKKLNIFLNKTIVEITRIGKNEKELRSNKSFWTSLEDEIFYRQTSLTNDQVTDILSNFGKSEISDLKIFDDFEDIVSETEIPYLVISF